MRRIRCILVAVKEPAARSSANTAEPVLDYLPCDLLVIKPSGFRRRVPRRALREPSVCCGFRLTGYRYQSTQPTSSGLPVVRSWRSSRAGALPRSSPRQARNQARAQSSRSPHPERRRPNMDAHRSHPHVVLRVVQPKALQGGRNSVFASKSSRARFRTR